MPKFGTISHVRRLGQNQLDQAVASCRRAVQLRPDFAEAHNDLGAILERQGNWEAAAECFEQALCLRPELAESAQRSRRRLGQIGKAGRSHRSFPAGLHAAPDSAEMAGNCTHTGRQGEQIRKCAGRATASARSRCLLSTRRGAEA